jgi:dolichyl-phosphate beta-glucosyltransferase
VRRRLRRFAAVGVVVTAVDIGLLLVLQRVLGLHALLADTLAVTVAVVASYLLHRSVTFGDDPHIRWVHEPATFAWVAGLAGAVDVTVFGVAAAMVGTDSLAELLIAKAAAVTIAVALRGVSYRDRLFRRVRDEQGRRAERAPAPGTVRLSVVLPAYNEGERIGLSVARVRDALASVVGNGGLEIVVVDDGSGDDTAAAARRGGADLVVEQAENAGKGAAVRAGALAATGRTIVFTDADLSYAPSQILNLLAKVEDGWDVAVGTRRHVEARTLVQARRLRELTSRVFNTLTTAVLLGQYRDTQCGLKAFRSDVARLLFSHAKVDGFAFDVEVFHLAERYRLSLTEVPVDVVNFHTSSMRVGVDALLMVRDLFRIRRWAGRGVYDLTPEEGQVVSRRR